MSASTATGCTSFHPSHVAHRSVLGCQPQLPAGAGHSRKLVNCSGIPKFSAFKEAITDCKSSRFLEVTRN